jgi:hypothetical protein
VNLGFATQPSGLALNLNGDPAPSSLISWEGWKLQVDTPSPQFDSTGGDTFLSWSDGGAPSHTITTPSTDTTYTATFTRNYARPRGATEVRVPLVPSYRRCNQPDRTHGAPLAYGSCSSPRLISNYLTLGTPDANGLAAQSFGVVRFTAVPGNTSTPADVRILASLSNVYAQGPVLTAYTGDIQVRAGLRLTDRLSGQANDETGTVRDFSFNVRVPCAPAVGAGGSTCQTDTTADAVVPGAVVQSKRTIWEINQVLVVDGGSDGSISTPGNTIFATQGLFVP